MKASIRHEGAMQRAFAQPGHRAMGMFDDFCEPMDSKPYRAYLYMHIVHLLNIVVLQVTATYSFSGMPSQLEWQVMP